jgi:hypothetical protein
MGVRRTSWRTRSDTIDWFLDPLTWCDSRPTNTTSELDELEEPLTMRVLIIRASSHLGEDADTTAACGSTG